jgi:hypothetical protein
MKSRTWLLAVLVGVFVTLAGTAYAGVKALKAAAPPGPANISMRVVETEIGSMTDREFVASCPAGARAIGGGWSTHSHFRLSQFVEGTTPDNVPVIYSLDDHPTEDGTGWNVFLTNVGDAGDRVAVYAVCASA